MTNEHASSSDEDFVLAECEKNATFHDECAKQWCTKCKVESMQHELLDYKRLLWEIREENVNLKSKMRRLEDSLRKQHKIIDAHFLASNTKLFNKTSQSSLTISKLEEENEDLKKRLLDKEATIRSLQKNLNVYSAYSKKPLVHKTPSAKSLRSETAIKVSNLADPNSTTQRTDDTTTSNSARRSQSLEIKNLQVKSLEMKSFEDDLKLDEQRSSTKTHDEVLKLHDSFKDITAEVQRLRKAVNGIQERSTSSVNDVKQKSFKEIESWKAEQAMYESLTNNASEITSEGNNANVLKQFNAHYQKCTSQKHYPPMKMIAEISTKGMPRPTNRSRKSRSAKLNENVIRTKSHTIISEGEINQYIDEVVKNLNRGSLL